MITIEKGRELTRAQTTPVLIASLLALSKTIELERACPSEAGESADTKALDLVRHWVIDVLEERYPEVISDIDQAYAEAETNDTVVDYVAVLTAAVRTRAAR